MPYVGNRMSLNAVYAYDQGEKPLSKYNKEDAVMINANKVRKLTKGKERKLVKLQKFC